METITLETFDSAVSRYFEILAQKLELRLDRLKDGFYEIPSPYFTMRIRFEIGHRKSISATLFPTKERPANLDDKIRELGVAVFAGYNGEDMHTKPVSTVEEFLQLAELTAKMAERFCVPYLLGQKNDFEQVKEYVDKLIEESGIRQKKWSFPKNVQKRWHLPPPDFKKNRSNDN